MKWPSVGIACLACMFLAHSVASGQVVFEPTTAKVGEKVVGNVSATIPEGATFKGGWQFYCDGVGCMVQTMEGEDGTGIWSTKAGKYTGKFLGYWVLKGKPIKVKDEETGELVELIPHLGDGWIEETGTFELTGGTNPNPPPPPPSGDIATQVRNLAGQVAGATKVAEAQKLAAMYESLAQEIETASDPLSTTQLVSPEAALDRMAAEANAILGGRREAWQVWFTGVKAFMDKQFADGKLPKTVFGVGDAFVEIAKGLRSVAAAQVESSQKTVAVKGESHVVLCA